MKLSVDGESCEADVRIVCILGFVCITQKLDYYIVDILALRFFSRIGHLHAFFLFFFWNAFLLPGFGILFIHCLPHFRIQYVYVECIGTLVCWLVFCFITLSNILIWDLMPLYPAPHTASKTTANCPISIMYLFSFSSSLALCRFAVSNNKLLSFSSSCFRKQFMILSISLYAIVAFFSFSMSILSGKTILVTLLKSLHGYASYTSKKSDH